MEKVRVINCGTPDLVMKRKSLSISGQDVREKEKTTTFRMKEIGVRELLEKRMGDKPGFVLKIEDKLYYTEILPSWRFIKKFKDTKHLCNVCERISAAEDCNGGCQKVRDIFYVKYREEPHTEFMNIVIECKRIEKYPFIRWGYETFNTPHDIFIVLRCKNYDYEIEHERSCLDYNILINEC